MEHKHFVDTAIVELLKGGLVKEMSNRPHVLNPLTVSNNGEGKERLILDLRFAGFFYFLFVGVRAAHLYNLPFCLFCFAL
jgi:hypothetical protein